MKALVSSLAAVSLLAFAVHRVQGHYTFPYWVGDNNVESTDWQYIRMTANHIDNGPLTDVTSPLLRCYENSTAASTGTTTAVAGKTYSFMSDAIMGHPGTFNVYMAKVSDLTSETAGAGSVWFKVYQNAPYYNASAYTYEFPYINGWNVTFTIPKSTPSGNYLIRAEHIALHVASTFGGAQFYIACAQVTVTGGGSGVPSPLVAIPGVYTGNEPGILINIYTTPASGVYTPPGPAVWKG
ncbi:glycoside hydrolase family 61 protein [Clavulina sp. PMI_390]|nr:glycoside hydrolase family 61 protein [Clavulina sp. PMI_390]